MIVKLDSLGYTVERMTGCIPEQIILCCSDSKQGKSQKPNHNHILGIIISLKVKASGNLRIHTPTVSLNHIKAEYLDALTAQPDIVIETPRMTSFPALPN